MAIKNSSMNIDADLYNKYCCGCAVCAVVFRLILMPYLEEAPMTQFDKCCRMSEVSKAPDVYVHLHLSPNPKKIFLLNVSACLPHPIKKIGNALDVHQS